MPSSLAVIGKQTTGYASSKTLPKLRNVLSSFISLPQQETEICPLTIGKT